jgi:hypothetical protein
MAPAVTRHLDGVPSVRAVEAVRLLQAAAPIAATFTAPFSVGLGPDEDGTLLAVGRYLPSWRTHQKCIRQHRGI